MQKPFYNHFRTRDQNRVLYYDIVNLGQYSLCIILLVILAFCTIFKYILSLVTINTFIKNYKIVYIKILYIKTNLKRFHMDIF